MAIDGILAPGGETIVRLTGGAALPSMAHAGLVFDRYLALWEGEYTPQRKKLLEPLQRFVEAFNARRQVETYQHLLDELQQRLDRALPENQYKRIDYRTVWRLATGLGTDHPSDNGFTFDPVLGIPVLAGSGIKGLCRRAALHQDLGRQRVKELFGPESLDFEDEERFRGDLVFYDAYPSRWPSLCVDVINCHHPDYYRAFEYRESTGHRGDLYPSETESPIPVFFLAVEKGTSFTFRIGSHSHSRDNPNLGSELLDFGLRCLGLGAKTAVGYGVMEKDADLDTGEPGQRPTPWLDQKIVEISQKNHSSEEETLRGRQLAEAWAALPDGAEKQAVLAEIRRRWQVRGWWDQPQGRAVRQAHAIYTQPESRA